jgi:XTP/dITP diphosphohydrolase
MKFYLITGNKEKLATARMFYKELGLKKIDCPEIQDNDVSKIAAFSAKWAADNLNVPVIKNDCAFEIDSLKGFPGAFVAYIERWIDTDGFLKIMNGIKDRGAQFRDATAVCLPGEKPVVFTSVTRGVILTEPKGNYGWGLDKIFAVKGYKSLGEYTDEERIKLYTNDHWKKAAEYCKELGSKL